MGWTFDYRMKLGSIEGCRHEFKSPRHINEHFEFIDDTKNKNGYFQILQDKNTGRYLCFIYLLKYDRKAQEWGYKDLTDSCGVVEPCPAKLLKYLEKNPPELMNAYTKGWILRSKEIIEQKAKNSEKMSSIKAGSIIKITSLGSLMVDSECCKEFEVKKISGRSFLVSVIDNKNLTGTYNLSKNVLKGVNFTITNKQEPSLFDY